MRAVSAALVIAVCLVLAPSMPAFAAPSIDKQADEGSVGIGLGYLRGSTLYHISAYDATGGIESELEFPLDTLLFVLEGGYVSRNAKGQDAFKIGLQWSTNLGSGSGKLKDSDWISGTAETAAPPNGLGLPPHPGLDIYSESDITLKANIIDIRASYNIWPSEGLAIGPLGGLLYQKFNFDASNVHQTGYGPYAPGYTGSVPGRVLTYEVTYFIPYLGVHSELIVSKSFQAFLDLGFSPWASAEDKDDHVLRQKVSKATTSGNAYLAAIAAQWDIQDNNFFLIRGQYLNIDTKGTQTQTFYDGSGAVFTGIDDKITSKQMTATVQFNHRF